MLIKFSEWIKLKESSPATRNKWAVAMGTAVPMSADVFGHATPPAWQVPPCTVPAVPSRQPRRTKFDTIAYEVCCHQE